MDIPVNVLKIGIVGCGAIGSTLAKTIFQKYHGRAVLMGMVDLHQDKIDALARDFGVEIPRMDLERLFASADLVIEAASRDVVPRILDMAVQYRRDIMIMSVGGLLDQEERFSAIRQTPSISMYIPSGAIAGMDALKAACCAHVSSVTITTRKPPAGLKGAPYLKHKNIHLDTITEETLVFEGNVSEAIDAFPRNINVSVLLSLAGLGPKKTHVRIIADPHATKNIHDIDIQGAFGRVTTRCENHPSPTNPKTSYLAILSAEAVLAKILDNVCVGT